MLAIAKWDKFLQKSQLQGARCRNRLIDWFKFPPLQPVEVEILEFNFSAEGKMGDALLRYCSWVVCREKIFGVKSEIGLSQQPFNYK